MLEFRFRGVDADLVWYSIFLEFNSFFFLPGKGMTHITVQKERKAKKGFCGSRAHFLLMLLGGKWNRKCVYLRDNIAVTVWTNHHHPTFLFVRIVSDNSIFQMLNRSMFIFQTWKYFFFFPLSFSEWDKIQDALKSPKTPFRVFSLYVYIQVFKDDYIPLSIKLLF